MNILQILFYLASLVVVSAVGIEDASIDIAKNGSLTASGITAGVILIVLGTMFLFFGRKLVKITIFFGGFFLFGILFLIVAYRIRAPLDGENTRAMIYLVVAIVVGLIGGALALWLFKLGLFILGGLGGFALAAYIMNWSSTGLFSQNWVRIVFIVAFVIVGGLLVLFFERPAIIISTSIYGSYALFVGIDCFAKTGFKESVASALSKTVNPVKNTLSVYGMLAGTIVLAIIGALVQFKTTKN
ncbi:hypothetical protein BB559_006928 [Furculomyces boomerangus]|uniref:Transmembrane protein 198 n=1 Tax=Furculomyces boomerangus TaxID=61424 RepID=A0A2T9XZU9_9FUNG|nr:hypothetical protein BB559_006928 [Furculomyces boomerangus]